MSKNDCEYCKEIKCPSFIFKTKYCLTHSDYVEKIAECAVIKENLKDKIPKC